MLINGVCKFFIIIYVLASQSVQSLSQNGRQTVADCPKKYRHLGIPTGGSAAGGQPALFRDFSHMAAIGWSWPDKVQWLCGGSLITHTFVLTAAHCLYDERNISPDVVRLGDLNLSSASDDESAQQFKISEIIRHPDYSHLTKYNDIALFRLDRTAKVDKNVVPVCLWNSLDFNFQHLEAAGWGFIDFDSKSDKLIKVLLTVVPNDVCKRTFENLIEGQMCAEGKAPEMSSPFQIEEVVMDTCSGDSGGPLEIKLIGKTHWLTYQRIGGKVPFQVGITSFGKDNSCGEEKVPAVYTRVSSYIKWIEAQVKESFDPVECALRNHELRVRQYTNVENTQPKANRVEFGNRNEENQVRCGGTVIDESFVLTSASCLSKFASGPNIVKGIKPVEKNLRNSYSAFEAEKLILEVGKIFLHPQYDSASKANDIALVQMKEKFSFIHSDQFACPLVKHNFDKYRSFVAHGVGPKSENLYGSDFDSTYNFYLSIMNSTKCSRALNGNSKTSSVSISKNQFCAENSDDFIVPKTCQIDFGGPMQSEEESEPAKRLHFLYGIISYGDNCGFGSPIVAADVSSHIEWIDSIMYGDAKAV